LSDSVANLTVKVDTKSVAAAIAALDKLAVAATAVEKSVGGIGKTAGKPNAGTKPLEEGAKRTEGALARMEARVGKTAQEYAKFNRMMDKFALDIGVRADLQNRLNREFERHNRIISNVSASQRDLNSTTQRWKNTLYELKERVDADVKLQKQRTMALKDAERQVAKNAAIEDSAAKQGLARAVQIEAAFQRAKTAASGISLRALRQTPMEQAFRIDADAQRALARYTSVLNQFGTNSVEAKRAGGDFNRTLQSLSNEIAKTGGLLTRVSDGARVFSAAFGAANASLGGFSRVAFNTAAALSALSGTLALREIIQAGLEIDKFINTLKTVSEGSLGFQRNLNFLFDEANRVGFAVGDVGNSFARLSLAMKGAGFQGGETRQVFSELIAASRNFGLSSADTMGVIRALEQSMSKGKFMAEEVRNQLGDRLPVALAALERAVTKVDGKQSDLNKRFEEGTIDTRRYAVEFVRQIYALSGGAETLNRTSQSVGSAFGRLTTELTKTNMLFKEAGFDAALISTTDQIRKLIETARESGAVEALAKSLVTLANNLDMVAGALTAFASVGFIRLLTALASKWVAIGLAVAAVGAGIASAFRGPERDLAQFEQTTKQFDKTYAALSDRINTVNASLASGTAQAASSAESNFERLIRSYEKLGFAASKALEMALKVQVEENKKALGELENQLTDAQKKASEIITDYTRGAQARIASETVSLGFAFKELSEQLDRVPLAVDAWVKSLVEGKMPLSEFQENLNFLKERLEKIADGKRGFDPLIANVQSLMKVLESPVDTGNISKAILEVLRLSGLVQNAKMALGAQQQQATAVGEGRLNDVLPPVENLPMAAGARPQLRFSGYTSIKEAQDIKAGEDVLQKAYRETQKNATAVVDTTLYLQQVRSAADAKIPGAQKILDDYNEALAKNDKKLTGAEKSLSKYISTLRIEIEENQGLINAYKQSTLAGEEMELQIKAQTKALDFGKEKTDEYKAALKAILPLMRERKQQERTDEVVKANTRLREEEIAVLEKERELIGASTVLREQELAILKLRQQYRGAPDEISALETTTRKSIELRQQNDRLDKSYQAIADIGVRAFEQVGDAITEAFAKGEIRALNFGNVMRGVMSSIIQSILRLGVVNPIINSIFSGTSLPTLGLGLSAMGGAGAAAAAGGGGMGIMQMLGLSSLIPKEGLFGAMGLTGPGGLLSTQLIAPTGMVAIAEPSIATGAAGLMAPSGGLSLGGFLGAAGLGFGAGNLFNNLIGGNQTGGMVGSGLGSAAGALLAGAGLLGPLGPIGAALIGGLAGGGLGGLFGPGESDRGFSYAVRGQNGRLAMTDMFYNEQGRAQFQEAEAGINAINAYLQQRGLSVTGDRAVGGNRFGMGNLGYGEAASFSEAIASMNFAATANDELNRALSGRSFAGLEKLQGFVEGFISIQDTIKGLTEDPIPEFTKQMDALIDSFAQAAAKAREYGISEDDLNDARDAGIAKLEKQRALTIRDTALGLEIRRLTALGLDQQAEQIQLSYNTQKEIESFTASLDALALTAEEKSKMLVKLEEVQAEERAAIMRESTRGISDFLDSLRVGGLSGTTGMGRLAAAGEIFNRDLSAAQTGDKNALQRITQSSETYLNLAREIYGSTSGFHDIRDVVTSSLQGLIDNPIGQSLMDINNVPFVKEMAGLGQTAFESASLEYSKRFDEKLESLLVVAENIQTAVEKTAEVQAYAVQQDYVFNAESSSGGGFGGDMSGGGGGGMAAALGAALYHGKVMAYANGGIPDYVNSPTLAPMALFGEAGPEAIMPLRRGPDGRLGVEVNGGNTQAVVGELRAVRNAIESLEETVARNDADQGSALLEAVSGLQIQIGELREELRTSRLRAQ
jgi:tape measure domain-containing protein